MTTQENRLAEIRSAIEAENVSYGELAELQDIAAERPELFAGDALLAEAAGIPEEQWNQAPKLTRKQERQNANRRNRALTVLAQYAEIAGTEGEVAPLWAADLLTDILHLLGETVFDKCLRTARDHYEAERRGEE